MIEDAGFTIIDDLLHGYGGGYFPPILGSRSRPAGPIPQEPFEAGMTVVIQPNVVTRDGKAGVQTGELVRITATGIERCIHSRADLRGCERRPVTAGIAVRLVESLGDVNNARGPFRLRSGCPPGSLSPPCTE